MSSTKVATSPNVANESDLNIRLISTEQSTERPIQVNTIECVQTGHGGQFCEGNKDSTSEPSGSMVEIENFTADNEQWRLQQQSSYLHAQQQQYHPHVHPNEKTCTQIKGKGNRGNGNNNNHKCHFRAPQQFGQKKKKWNKQFKMRQKLNLQLQLQQQQQMQQQPSQQLLQINKADMENMQNLKNQANYRSKQHTIKNVKTNFNKMNAHRTAQFSIRSKFFLPDKRPRKEIIIPPTKFLLGGNISDPLNLNSLQDEAMSATTPTPTPKQSPITTPPKVEVIIPPNIHDPLHLLDPVDSVEYEKQLVSPMKRKSKSKHRHRKKKPKRKRLESTVSTVSSVGGVPSTASSIGPCDFSAISFSSGVVVSTDNIVGASGKTTIACKMTSGNVIGSDLGVNKCEEASALAIPIGSINENNPNVGTDDLNCGTMVGFSSGTLNITDMSGHCIVGGSGMVSQIRDISGDFVNNKHAVSHSVTSATSTSVTSVSDVAIRRSIDREKAHRDLRLDLSLVAEHLQQHQCQQQSGNNGGRKRRISEGPNSSKSKFRRMDSMDKIVSPVVPQPGAWKRPPRTVPTGARKGSRVHSTSISESDVISPSDEVKTIESESVRGDTPDIESVKVDDQGLDLKVANDQSQKQQTEPVQRMPKFKKDDIKYQYGNYDRYAGYRNLNEFMDVRLKVFQRNPFLFKDKDVLDIGCNVGHLTIAVARNLSPKSILGIDIDSKLIARARKNLSLYVKIPKEIETVTKPISSTEPALSLEPTTSTNNACNSKQNLMGAVETTKMNVSDGSVKRKRRRGRRRNRNDRENSNFFPISFPICYGGINELLSNLNKSDSPLQSSSSEKIQFPSNVFFRMSNYVLKDESMLNNDTQQYDLILCLSVTKWIHLNFGDAGLKLAFKRMFNQLRPGGKLILEAQNWASYKKKKNLTETIYNNYRNIEFFPNKFHEYLLSNEVGFSHSYPLGVPRHLSKGFCRPIQLYAKGDFTPNHVRWSDNYHPQTPAEAYQGIYAGVGRPQHRLWSYDTPRGNSENYSRQQTPLRPGLSTSQYYNPLETDSYLPSYDTEVPNRHYVFASPLYQTVWSPPASLRNSSSHTPVFGSVREADNDDSQGVPRHVYPPTDGDGSSPIAANGAGFNSIREVDLEDNNSQQAQQMNHVYANCDNSSSPRVASSAGTSPVANRVRILEPSADSYEDIRPDSNNLLDADSND